MLYVEWDGRSDELQVEVPFMEDYLARIRLLKAERAARFGEGADGRKYWFVKRRAFGRFASVFEGEFVSDPKPHVILNQPAPPPPAYLHALDNHQPPNVALPLFPYQVVGSSFLANQIKQGLPAILADSRGLGKTPQAIGALERLWAGGILQEGRPVLAITLASLKIQTVRDGFGKFAPHRTVAAALGDKKRRMKLYAWADMLDALVINYELLLHDWDILSKIPFQLYWGDEAHLKIANPDGKMHQSLIGLGLTGFLTTGSPVRKNPLNLYGLVHALNPNYLGDLDEYVRMKWTGNYAEVAGYRNLHRFVELTEPLVLRRTPEDAGIRPPELQVTSRYVEMTKLQTELEELARLEHADWRTKRIDEQRKGDNADPGLVERYEGKEKLMTWVRHAIADDPLTLLEAGGDWSRRTFGEPVMKHIKAKYKKSLAHLSYADILQLARQGHIELKNPKLDLLLQSIEEEILPEKVLIFTGLKTVARTVYRAVRKFGAAFYVGGMSEIERDRQLQHFINDPKCHVLVMTDAGGVGLNIQAAKFGVNFNMNGDFSVVDQRQGRNNRLGSAFDENIWINLIAEKSIDEVVLRSQRRGQKVSNFLVGSNERTQKELQRLTGTYA